MFVMLGAENLHPDEPCFSLKEIVLSAPDGKSIRRYRVVKVIRQTDKLAEAVFDMGPAKNYMLDEFVIPGGVRDDNGRIDIVETVGRLVDIADTLHSSYFVAPDRPKPHNLVQGYYDGYEKRKLNRIKRSMFGPSAVIQRG